jgi:hypothetical protein
MVRRSIEADVVRPTPVLRGGVLHVTGSRFTTFDMFDKCM